MKQISVLAVGQIILVHVWELIAVSVSSNVKVVPNLENNEVELCEICGLSFAARVRKIMTVMDVRCTLYER